jgi:hypothetical protein
MDSELVYVAVPAAELDRIRRNGHDDVGNAVVPRAAVAGCWNFTARRQA